MKKGQAERVVEWLGDRMRSSHGFVNRNRHHLQRQDETGIGSGTRHGLGLGLVLWRGQTCGRILEQSDLYFYIAYVIVGVCICSLSLLYSVITSANTMWQCELIFCSTVTRGAELPLVYFLNVCKT